MGLGMRLQLLHKYLTVTILNNELIMTISHSLNWVVTGQMLRNNSAIMLADISEGLRALFCIGRTTLLAVEPHLVMPASSISPT